MGHGHVLVLALLCTFLLRSDASFLSEFAPQTASHYRNNDRPPITTTVANTPAQHGLRKRDGKSSNICGAEPGGDVSGGNLFWCLTRSELCTNTLLWRNNTYEAYQYCSNSGLATQSIYTGGNAEWEASKPCPASQICCSEKFRYVQTILYVTSDYTVTGLDCVESAPLTALYLPRKNLLDPSKFSASIASLNSSVVSSNTSTASPNKNAPSLSSSAEIGVGVGVGLVAVALFVSILFWIRRRRRRRSEAKSVSEPVELPGREYPHELGSKFWDSPELPSHENPKEMSVGEVQELPGHWEPPELSGPR